MSSKRGFTLVELLITVSVVGIIASLASPYFASTVSNNRGYAAQTEFVAYLALARSEAVRLNVPVVLSAVASTTGNEFGGGWMVWVDQNSDGMLQSSETVLRTHEALPPSVYLGGGNVAAITYGATGFLVPTSAVNLRVCSPNGPQGFDIAIQPNGMTDVSQRTPQPCP